MIDLDHYYFELDSLALKMNPNFNGDSSKIPPIYNYQGSLEGPSGGNGSGGDGGENIPVITDITDDDEWGPLINFFAGHIKPIPEVLEAQANLSENRFLNLFQPMEQHNQIAHQQIFSVPKYHIQPSQNIDTQGIGLGYVPIEQHYYIANQPPLQPVPPHLIQSFHNSQLQNLEINRVYPAMQQHHHLPPPPIILPSQNIEAPPQYHVNIEHVLEHRSTIYVAARANVPANYITDAFDIKGGLLSMIIDSTKSQKYYTSFGFY